MKDAHAQDTGFQDNIVVQDRCDQRDAKMDSWIPATTDIIQIHRHGVGQVWQGTLARLLYLEQGDTWRPYQRDHLEVRIHEVPEGPVE